MMMQAYEHGAHRAREMSKKGYVLAGVGVGVGAMVLVGAALTWHATTAMAAQQAAATPTPSPQVPTMALTLAPGAMPAVSIPALNGAISLSTPNGVGSITALGANVGFVLGDNTSGPEQKPLGVPPTTAGAAGTTTTGWSFQAAWKGQSGIVTVVWYDAQNVAQTTTIPITLT